MENINPSEFGKRLKDTLKIAKISQKQLAEKIGISKTSINNYVQGRIPDTPILYKIAKVCSVQMEWLLSGENSQEKNSTIVEHNNNLSPTEVELLTNFRKLSDIEKGRILGNLEEKVSSLSNDNPKSKLDSESLKEDCQNNETA